MRVVIVGDGDRHRRPRAEEVTGERQGEVSGSVVRGVVDDGYFESARRFARREDQGSTGGRVVPASLRGAVGGGVAHHQIALAAFDPRHRDANPAGSLAYRDRFVRELGPAST